MPRSLISVLTPHGAWNRASRRLASRKLLRSALKSVSSGGPDTPFCNWCSREAGTLGPPELAFSRSFAMRFVAALGSRTEAIAVPPPPLQELTTLIDAAPPMPGGEYLDTNPVTPLSSRRHHPLFSTARRGQIAL